MKQSKLFNLNWADLGRGLLIAFLTALLGGILEKLQTGELPTTWVAFQPILELSLSAAVAYLLKNLFTNSEGQLMRGEKSAAEYRAKRAGKLLILLPLMLLLSASVSAQSFIHKVTPESIANKEAVTLRSTDTLSYNGQGAFFLRGGGIASYSKFYYDKETKKILPDDYVRAGVGLEFAHYYNDNGAAVNDYGIGLYFLAAKSATNDVGFCSVLASVSAYDLRRLLNMSFLPEGMSISPGVVYDFRTDIPTVERFGFVPSLTFTF